MIEYAFGLPGLGRLTVVAINQRNYTVVQGGILVLAVMFIAVNLLVDVLVGVIDPRVADGAAGMTAPTIAAAVGPPRPQCGAPIAGLIIGAAILGVLVVAALLAPWIAPRPRVDRQWAAARRPDAPSPVRNRRPRPRRAVAGALRLPDLAARLRRLDRAGRPGRHPSVCYAGYSAGASTSA